MVWAGWVSFAAALGLAFGGGDRVVLKNGKALEGRVVFDDGSKLVLRQDGRDTPIERAEIERVQSRARDLHDLLDNAAQARLDDLRSVQNLVEQAGEMGLEGETRLFSLRVLLLDPESDAAHRSLGHERRGGGWTAPLGGRRVAWEKRLVLARDWGSAFELESLHYRVRSNLPLPDVLDAVLELERFYRSFYELFGAELELYDVCKPMSVHLHADRASYPDQASEIGLYEPETDVVHIDASLGLVRDVLFHEATHQLLHDTAWRERGRSGTIPAWLDEGLAEYLAGSGANPSDGRFEPGRPRMHHFQAHAQARKPFDLARVLSLASGDYLSTSERDLKYAQSYTFVHFLLHGSEERFRSRFFQFLRSVYRGQGSKTALERALGTHEAELERSWNEHVRTTKP